MADEHGPPPGDLTWLARLAADPTAFGFHAALRRFDASFPGRPRLGEAERPSEEPVRVGQVPSLHFEGNEITGFEPGEGGVPGRLAVGFLGMWGPHGALPGHITEYARDRLRHAGDATLARFVDLFHHRMLLLFHRAWAKSQPTVAMDRPGEDPFALYIGAFMGLGSQSMRNRAGPNDYGPLHYTGLLGTSARNADGLRDLLADSFGLPTQVEEFVGEWIEVPDDARWSLHLTRETGTLGQGAVLGGRVWSRTHKFRVVFGPLNGAQFEDILPGSPMMERLRETVALYTNDEWEWEVRLVLAPDATRRLRLGGKGRLGWTTRLGAGPAIQVDLLVEPARGRTQRVTRPAERNP